MDSVRLAGVLLSAVGAYLLAPRVLYLLREHVAMLLGLRPPVVRIAGIIATTSVEACEAVRAEARERQGEADGEARLAAARQANLNSRAFAPIVVGIALAGLPDDLLDHLSPGLPLALMIVGSFTIVFGIPDERAMKVGRFSRNLFKRRPRL